MKNFVIKKSCRLQDSPFFFLYPKYIFLLTPLKIYPSVAIGFFVLKDNKKYLCDFFDFLVGKITWSAFGVEGNDFFVVKMLFKDCRFQSYSYYAFIAFLCIRKFYFCYFVIMTWSYFCINKSKISIRSLNFLFFYFNR